MFDNPLKGFPYNESVNLTELEEEIDALILAEGLSKKMDIEKYAKKVGFNSDEVKWIMDNEDEDHYENNSAMKNEWSALSYPIRGGDYYFAFIGDRMTDTSITKANNKMNDAMRKHFQMGQKKLDTFYDDDAEYSKKDMLASYMWNEMSQIFEKLPGALGADDTMTRECLYTAIKHMTDDGEIMFEELTQADEIIQEGMFKNLAKGIAGKIRNKLRKVKKKIKLGKRAKDLFTKKVNEGSFYGRDDLVKQFATPKNKKHLFVKLRKTDSKGTHGVSMAKKGNEKKIADYKRQGYKEVPVESVEEGYKIDPTFGKD
jgi:DNA-binding transcriptional MerR regulator